MSVGKRITSFILSMAMLAGNMVSPMTAYADEAYTETGQTQAESPTGDVQMPAGQSDSNTGWSDSSGAGEADSASAETTRQTEAPNFRLVLPEDDALDLVYDQAHFSSVEKNSASRPSVESKTNEEEVEVQTETLSVKATPMANGCVKAKTGDDTTDSVYQNWYSAVYLPVELPAEEPANG